MLRAAKLSPSATAIRHAAVTPFAGGDSKALSKLNPRAEEFKPRTVILVTPSDNTTVLRLNDESEFPPSFTGKARTRIVESSWSTSPVVGSVQPAAPAPAPELKRGQPEPAPVRDLIDTLECRWGSQVVNVDESDDDEEMDDTPTPRHRTPIAASPPGAPKPLDEPESALVVYAPIPMSVMESVGHLRGGLLSALNPRIEALYESHTPVVEGVADPAPSPALAPVESKGTVVRSESVPTFNKFAQLTLETVSWWDMTDRQKLNNTDLVRAMSMDDHKRANSYLAALRDFHAGAIAKQECKAFREFLKSLQRGCCLSDWSLMGAVATTGDLVDAVGEGGDYTRLIANSLYEMERLTIQFDEEVAGPLYRLNALYSEKLEKGGDRDSLNELYRKEMDSTWGPKFRRIHLQFSLLVMGMLNDLTLGPVEKALASIEHRYADKKREGFIKPSKSMPVLDRRVMIHEAEKRRHVELRPHVEKTILSRMGTRQSGWIAYSLRSDDERFRVQGMALKLRSAYPNHVPYLFALAFELSPALGRIREGDHSLQACLLRDPGMTVPTPRIIPRLPTLAYPKRQNPYHNHLVHQRICDYGNRCVNFPCNRSSGKVCSNLHIDDKPFIVEGVMYVQCSVTGCSVPDAEHWYQEPPRHVSKVVVVHYNPWGECPSMKKFGSCFRASTGGCSFSHKGGIGAMMFQSLMTAVYQSTGSESAGEPAIFGGIKHIIMSTQVGSIKYPGINPNFLTAEMVFVKTRADGAVRTSTRRMPRTIGNIIATMGL